MDERKIKELAEKYNVNLDALIEEQRKLRKKLILKDSIDFSNVTKIGGISSTYYGKKIISAVVVVNSEFEVLEQRYFSRIVDFPYIPGFRAYRELPAMISAVEKLQEKPDVVFIDGHGIAHLRLGLASHFSLFTGIPSIGIAKKLLVGDVKDNEIFLRGKKVGVVLKTKEGSKPIYVSPGSLISLNTAVKLTRKFVKEPHKLPEPLHLAHRYADEVRRELSL